ncbi:putative helix-loop-helix DNA-binding domain-containing protein [Colletotrichum tabaci]|nr:Protein max [Colletotrichum higginsianum]WQF87284.1 Putative myc-type, basic helix-loop-helix (bHLH) domain-containing protein [Colletotrichum destructivum]
MSSPNKSNSPSAPADAEQPEEKPRLTEAEKKQNHIASEQKRRQAIREGFDRLTELVPGLEGQGRSEGLVLKKTVEFMKEQLRQRQELVDRIESTGGEVDEKYKRPLFHQQANSTSSRTR